jgi:hypothetical protein
MHFVHRYHVQGEMRPDFADRSSWYNIPLIRRTDGALSYTNQRDSVLEALNNYDINCSKKTHLGRDVSVTVCTQAGLPENSMKRHGKKLIL